MVDFDKNSDLNAGDEVDSVSNVEEERGEAISKNVQPRIYTEKDYQKFIDQDEGTQAILNKKYQEYDYDPTIPSKPGSEHVQDALINMADEKDY